jgi:hypothetical protein
MSSCTQGGLVFKNILFFIFGVFISALVSFYYFTDMIKTSSEFNKLVVNNHVDYFKTTYSDDALKIIKLSNTYIQKSMSAPLDKEQIVASQILLASSLFLTKITDQRLKSKKNTFLSMMMFYARTKSEEEFNTDISNTSEFCSKHTDIKDCSPKAMLAMFVEFKKIKYE